MLAWHEMVNMEFVTVSYGLNILELKSSVDTKLDSVQLHKAQ